MASPPRVTRRAARRIGASHDIVASSSWRNSVKQQHHISGVARHLSPLSIDSK